MVTLTRANFADSITSFRTIDELDLNTSRQLRRAGKTGFCALRYLAILSQLVHIVLGRDKSTKLSTAY
jgi:hypothetical protein